MFYHPDVADRETSWRIVLICCAWLWGLSCKSSKVFQKNSGFGIIFITNLPYGLWWAPPMPFSAKWSVNIFLFVLNMYLLAWKAVETAERERERERCSIHWFALQMIPIAGATWSQRQGPESLPRSPLWLSGNQELNPRRNGRKLDSKYSSWNWSHLCNEMLATQAVPPHHSLCKIFQLLGPDERSAVFLEVRIPCPKISLEP